MSIMLLLSPAHDLHVKLHSHELFIRSKEFELSQGNELSIRGYDILLFFSPCVSTKLK